MLQMLQPKNAVCNRLFFDKVLKNSAKMVKLQSCKKKSKNCHLRTGLRFLKKAGNTYPYILTFCPSPCLALRLLLVYEKTGPLKKLPR